MTSFSIRIWFSAPDAASPNLPANQKKQKSRSPNHQDEANVNPAVDVIVFRPGKSVMVTRRERKSQQKSGADSKRQRP
jgi:hypothetical protein